MVSFTVFSETNGRNRGYSRSILRRTFICSHLSNITGSHSADPTPLRNTLASNPITAALLVALRFGGSVD